MKARHCVFLVDHDRAAWRDVSGLATTMQVDCKVFTTAEEFLQSPAWEYPGCLVMEFRLLGMNGLELQQELTSRGGRLPVIYMSAHAETRLTVRAMRHGAITVLEKPVSQHELWDSIREAFSRNSELRRIDAAHEEIQRKINRLSVRERQVLRLVVTGKTNKVIAGKLRVSVRTVESCRHSLLIKTQTSAVADLVRFAFEAKQIGGDL